MKTKIFSLLVTLIVSGVVNSQDYTTSAPAQCTDVMLQGFYWNSYDGNASTTLYGRTKWIDWLNQKVEDGVTSRAEEAALWFDLIWLPPMSQSTGGNGYVPTCYSRFDSDWGTKQKLLQLIETFHSNGAGVMADIVINHRGNKSNWTDFYADNFDTFGSFQLTQTHICSTDEAFYNSQSTAYGSSTHGAADDGYGADANFEGARDLDHTNPEIQAWVKAYLRWLVDSIGIDGFHYDYCKGYHNSHINEYNIASKVYFSVMEYWDENSDVLQSRLNDAEWNTLAFDIATKYTAFNNGIASNNYTALQGPGLLGIGKSRYAVTFLDNHDSFQRYGYNEFCGDGNSMTTCQDKILECYAYLLSMPGVPCVFYPHWVTFKDPIKRMINARYKTGVHSESTVSDEAGSGYYKANITGSNGEIRLLLGPNSNYNEMPAGYTLAIKGINFGVYYKVNSERKDKDERLKYYVSVTCDNTQGIINGQNGYSIHGSELTFNAIPNYGYHFTHWSDGNTDNPRTIVLTQDTAFTAEFAIDRTGRCGNDSLLTWTYNPTEKTLTISGEGAFDQNMQCGIEARSELENLVFENGVTSIGVDAFKNLTTLQTLIIGKDVKKINENAFYNCEKLKVIYNYRPSPTNVYSSTFDGVDKFECKLYVPKASIELYQNAFVWRDFYYTQIIQYIVQFVDWNGTILSEQKVTEEESAIAPANPSREGYTFIGWDKEFDSITGPTIVTAQYTINRYKVNFVDWDATLLKTDSVEWHTAAVAPTAPNRDWYTFIGWDKDFSVVVADLLVTALYKEGQTREFTVLFSNGTDDSEIDIDTISFKFPAPPSITGFRFIRWEFKTTVLNNDIIEIQAIYEAEEPSAIPDIVTNPVNSAQKLIRNGDVYILSGDKTYTIQGQKVK